MRFVRYLHSGVESYGLLSDDKIINLKTLADVLETPLPSTMEELIGLGEEAKRTVEQLMLNSTKTEKRKATLKIGDAAFLAPVSSPPKILCLGLNYRDHAEEAGADIPDEPIIFMKPRTAIVGPDEPIIRPTFVKELDYEAELAIIMGKKAKISRFRKPKNTFSDTLPSTTSPPVKSNSKIDSGREARASTPLHHSDPASQLLTRLEIRAI